MEVKENNLADQVAKKTALEDSERVLYVTS